MAQPRRKAAGAGRPTKAQSAQMREALLVAATQEFIRLGYSGATIDGIVELSKIGKMTVYRHFPGGKEQLFRAVVVNTGQNLADDFKAVATQDRPMRDVIRDFVAISFDRPSSGRFIEVTRSVISEAERFPDLAYLTYMQRREMLRPLTDYLGRLVETNRIRMNWSLELATFQLFAMASGGIRSLLLPRELVEINRTEWIDSAVEVFLNGVAVEEQP